MRPRALMWVQSRLGLGHLSRGLTLCGALASEGFEAVLAHGGPPAPTLATPPGVTLAQLPIAFAPDLASSEIRDDQGRAIDDSWRARRIEALKSIIEEFQPHIVMTESFPLGRWLFAFELIPILEWLHTLPARPLIVASVRDILVRPSRAKKVEAMIGLSQTRYDMILCHSDPQILKLPESFPETSLVSGKTRYTGYVVNARATPADVRSGVMISAGGGAVGGKVFDAAIAARRLWKRDTGPWTLVAGPRFNEDALTRLKANAPADLTIVDAVEGLAGRYARASIIVAQAGYNTVSEALAHRARLTVVPYATVKETEQEMRAHRFEQCGLLTSVAEETLTPPGLVAAMEAALDAPPPKYRLRFDGGVTSATILRHALAAHRS